MDQTDFQWPPLEGNPEIFQDYMNELGLPEGYGFSELFGMDEDLLAMAPTPVHAVILNMEELNTENDKTPISTGSWFMKQTDALDNACGFIACLHAIFNSPAASAHTTSKLGECFDQTQTMSPLERAQKIAGDAGFKEVHRKYAGEGQSNQAQTDSDVKHHFVAFVKNSQNQLVELDGMCETPKLVKNECEDILRDSVAEVKRRLEAGIISEHMSMITFGSL